MVITPGLEKPDSACDGEITLAIESTIMAPSSTISVGAGVVASRNRTVPTTARVNQISHAIEPGSPFP